jgi:hypothetical protein
MLSGSRVGLRVAPLAFHCIFTATAAAAQQTKHITAAAMSGVISKCIENKPLSRALVPHFGPSQKSAARSQ